MAIGDILFGLLGQQDPRQQLLRAVGGGPAVANPIRQNWQGPASPQARLSQGTQQPPSASPAVAAPQPQPAVQQQQGQPDQGQQPQGQQQGQQQGPLGSPGQPSPQAYQSPSDLIQLYDSMLRRQQANAQITSGMGLIASAFSRNPQDRTNILNATNEMARSQGSGAGMPSLGDIMNLQQAMWQRQMLMAQMSHLPAIAKEMNISPEMAWGLFANGKLGDVMQNISQSQYQQGTPQYQAELKKTLADAGYTTAQTQKVPYDIAEAQARTGLTQAQTGAIPSTIAKTQAETAEAQARTGAIPADVALKQAQTKEALATVPKTQADIANIQATTQKTLQDVGMPTEQIKNYTYYATGELQGKRQPVSFGDWLASGGMNPTEQQKDYRLAMSQIPEGQPKPTFNEWTAQIAGLKEGYTQSALLRAQQQMQAQGQLPDVTNKILDQIRLADEISANKNLGDLTGTWGAHIGKMAAATGLGQSDLQAKIDQLAGGAGVAAVDSLKGVGRILGTEFAAGTEAQSRLHSQQVSANEYQGAISDYRKKLADQLRVVYQRAGAPIPADVEAALKGPQATQGQPLSSTQLDWARGKIKSEGRDATIKFLQSKGYDTSGL